MNNITANSLRLLLAAFVFFMISPKLQAQINHGGTPLSWGEDLPLQIDWRTFESLDLKKLKKEDEATAKLKDAPWRFGVEHNVSWNCSETGTWSKEDGFDVWRMGVRSNNTTSWSFYLSEFAIPKGGELFIWNEERTQFLGSFTHENVKPWNGFSIGLLRGNAAVLEYRQPQGLEAVAQIEVGQVVQGYRSLLIRQDELMQKTNQGPFGNSGACNINVNCPEGADWQVEKKSVALIVNGGFAACTGSLVNNTANDGTPYFLTANHCLGSPNSWTYYFNHESSTCSGSSGPTDQSISGGTLLVADGGSDVALIELSSSPPSAWDIEYVGWDATGNTPENATGIHHPSGDVKKICFEEDSPYESSTGGAQVWWIDAWENGVTEPGSSGSPLFDQNHRIIGQLYGGAAACSGTSNNGSYDFYGRFNISWNLGLSTYLDPQNTGTLLLDGFPTGYNSDFGCTDATACNYNPAAITDDGSCAVDDACGVCGGNNSTCTGCTNPSACNYDSEAIVDDASCVLDGVIISFSLLTDNYPGEIDWAITDSNGVVVMEGSDYSGNQTTYEASTCVASGCYALTINDSYGDGLQYNGVVGDYTLTDGDGNILAQMVEGGNFGFQVIHDFCVDTNSTDVYGCTEPFACNFNAEATVDDGTCVDPYSVVYEDLDGDGIGGSTGIADLCAPLGPNLSLQTGDCDDTNGSVYPGAPGTGQGIDNNCNGTIDEEEAAPVYGCTEPFACNFDSSATADDGSCIDPYGIVYEDFDGDGIGGSLGIADICAPLGPNLSLTTGDCDDTDATVYPGATGTAAGIDNNCNGIIDEEEAAPSCPGDLNDDGVISVADLLVILAEFGCVEGCSGDADGDGMVGVSDVLALLSSFGSGC
jgi:hypothetical protein